MDSSATADEKPFMTVITPGTTDEEIAAIVAVLSAMGSGDAPAPRRTPEWNRPARLTRTAHLAGPGAWRASGLPR